QSDVNDVAEQKNNEQMRPILRTLRQQRHGEAQQSIKPELLEHARMQHRCRCGRGGIRFRSPTVERKKRDENSETDEQQNVNLPLRRGRDLPGERGSLQIANVEAARFDRNALVKQDQSEQQNETPEREINRDFPRSRGAIAASPDADQQKRRDQRQLVKGVEEKQVDRCERADCAAGNEKETRV